MKQKNKKFFRNSVRDAIDGLLRTMETERNFRIELIIAAIVTLGILFLPMTMIERGGMWFFVVLVLYAELMNTALERAVDARMQGYNIFARDAKDAAAAAVFLVSLAAFFYFCAMVWIVTPRIF